MKWVSYIIAPKGCATCHLMREKILIKKKRKSARTKFKAVSVRKFVYLFSSKAK